MSNKSSNKPKRAPFVPLEDRSTRTKNFNYLKGNVQLAFNLRTDVKTELKAFLELLEKAIKDVKTELES